MIDSGIEKGARRRPRHRRDTLRLFLLENAEYSKDNELPQLEAVCLEAPPVGLIPFSVAMRADCKDFDCFVHFYEDDFRFLRIWNDPRQYLSRLSRFAGVVMPDFSTCIDFPKPIKLWSCFRNHALASWFQRQGLLVLPNARHEPGCDYLLEALPQESVIAICGRAVTKNKLERLRFVRDVKTTVDELKPTAIVYYGSDFYHVMDYPRSLGIPVWVYPGCRRGELDGGRSELRGDSVGLRQ
ncbi:MAG: DUF4417 domain-containing protein [Coriobacteriia bacterium]|nr:DUF4417 domain-containing protein [Coriobacteriia bacterium]